MYALSKIQNSQILFHHKIIILLLSLYSYGLGGRKGVCKKSMFCTLVKMMKKWTTSYLVTDGKVCDYCSIQLTLRPSHSVSGACSLKSSYYVTRGCLLMNALVIRWKVPFPNTLSVVTQTSAQVVVKNWCTILKHRTAQTSRIRKMSVLFRLNFHILGNRNIFNGLQSSLFNCFVTGPISEGPNFLRRN